MMSAQIEQGQLLDSWIESRLVSITETLHAITVSRLNAELTRLLIAATERSGWQYDIHDGAGEPTEVNSVGDDLGPFVVTILKPKGEEKHRIVTLVGLSQALEQNSDGIWQVASARLPFSTGTIVVTCWNSEGSLSPSPETKSPLRLVREISEARLVPIDIRKWLLREQISDELWNDKAFQMFASQSIDPLLRSLASEVVGRQGITFFGPPRLSIELVKTEVCGGFERLGYQYLQAAASWVYEDTTTAEQKHVLYASELARSANRDERIAQVFNFAGRDILEGARLAFQLGQSELSRESIKAQGDLRKIVADDTAKASESARSLATSVAVAIATGVTLVAAKSTGSVQEWVLSVVTAVTAAYVLVVCFSGWAHLRLQRNLRRQWRQRFYRFIPQDDYDAMVTAPARQAELPYHLIGGVAVIVAAILLGMSVPMAPIYSSHLGATSTNPAPVPPTTEQPRQ